MQKLILAEAERRLPELISMAASGEDVVIIRGDGSSFKIVPLKEEKPYPKFGSAKAFIEMSDDVDEPLEGFKEYMP